MLPSILIITVKCSKIRTLHLCTTVSFVLMGYRASIYGLKLVEEARKLKGWKSQDPRWCQAASVDVSTLKRFRGREADLSEATFSKICEAVGITDWQKLTELSEKTSISYQDWGNAPSLETALYGRSNQLETLKNWIISDKCRLVAVRGLTGIGKTTLIRHLAEVLKDQFEFVLWRSLYPEPFSLQELIDDSVSFFLQGEKTENYSLKNLIDCFRKFRCLVILDDIQTILESKQLSGKYQQQFKDYQSLFEQASQVHQSCLIVIGNEQPTTISILKERSNWIQSLTLKELSKEASYALLKTLNLNNLDGYDLLAKNYCGNPFFIKFISEKIRNLSGGNISKYLNLGTNLIGGISEWLDDQFDRISLKEEQALYWLAVFRCPVSFQVLLEKMKWIGTNEEIFNCLESLIRRSLIDEIKDSNEGISYSLNSVLLKYVSIRFVDETVSEILNLIDTLSINRTSILCTHSLFLSSEEVDISESRQRYILSPIKQKLVNCYSVDTAIVTQLTTVLIRYATCQFESEYIAENIYGLINMFGHLHARNHEVI